MNEAKKIGQILEILQKDAEIQKKVSTVLESFANMIETLASDHLALMDRVTRLERMVEILIAKEKVRRGL